MKKQTFLFFCLATLLTGCAHDYYFSSIQNVPLFKEKYEFHLAGSYGIGDESQSGELQTAFAVTNHLGIMANFMKTKAGSFAEEDYVSGRNYDFGIGYFRPVGSAAVFEIYSGLGRNDQHHGYSTSQYNQTTGQDEYVSSGKSYLHFTKYYIQPAFGIAFDYFDAAASIRFNQLNFTSVNYNITDHSEDIEIMDLLSTGHHYIAEPAITLRSGWRNMKVQFQASYALNLNRLSDDEYDEEYVENYVEPVHISIGFYLTLANRWNKKK
jgi:hypothetical protein